MANISAIKLPSGTTYNIKDSISGYTTNTGTITKVQTTAGAHTTINVSSGAATFNVPTKTSHLTNDSGFITDAGVTGVKGNAEESYRTGQVNLTAENVKAYARGEVQIHRKPNNISAAPQHTSLANVKGEIEYTFSKPIAGIGDWFYAAHLNSDYIITCNYSGRHGTKGNFAISTLFSPSGSSTTLLDVDTIAETPFVLEIVKRDGSNITATDVVHLELWGHTISGTNAALSDYKVELYTTGSTSPTGTYTWQTVYQRTNASDKLNGLTMCLNPTSYSYLYFSGLRFTISGAIPDSTNTNAWNYNCIDLTLFRLVDQRPAFTTARALGALDLAGGTVYGQTTFRNGIIGNVTGNVTGNVSGSAGSVAWSGVSSKPTTLAGYGITDAKIASGVITLGSNTITPLTSSSTLNAAKLSGAIPSAVTATTQTAGDSSTKIATTAFVSSAISGLPTPMQFIGTVGTNGTTTWANLPAAAASNEGHTYKVITDHAAETGKPAAEAGDTIVSNGSSWIVIPSGDETATQSATTGISVGAHSTTSIYGVQSSTTSVRGVKTGDNSTTTASKVTLGTAISIPNVTGSSDVTVPIRADADTTVPVAASSATTVPIKATSATTVPIKNTSATSIPNVTAAGSGSASLTFAMDGTDTKQLNITFSHTHTPPTLGTAISIIGVQSSTTSVTGVQSSTTSVTGVSGSTTVRGVKTGDGSTTTASKVTLGTAKSVPNVTAATDVTVPIRADADTTVPIKNSSSTTVATSGSHSVTDNGHTHTI